jgi:hypothetical protein
VRVRLDRNLSAARRPSRSAVSIRAAGHALIRWGRGWGTYVTVVEVGGRAEPQRQTSIARIGGRCGALVLRRYARRMIRARTMASATLNGVAPVAAAQRSTSRVMAPMRATEAKTASGWSSMVS